MRYEIVLWDKFSETTSKGPILNIDILNIYVWYMHTYIQTINVCINIIFEMVFKVIILD